MRSKALLLLMFSVGLFAQTPVLIRQGGNTASVDATGALKVQATIDTSGLATSAKQDTGNTSLSSIDSKTPALGQALAPASVPVVLTAAQVATLTPPAAITGFATESTLSTLNGKIPSLVSGRIPVDGSGVTQPVSGTFWQATQPVSGTVTANAGTGNFTVVNGGTFATQAAQSGTWNITNISGTVSLPTGAATAAKQPALGTAGTASADVITVQGIASMTALKVDGSAVTQPVSGTVTVTDGAGALNVIVDSSALPSGAATVAEQQTQTTSLQLIDDAVTTTASAITTKGVAASGTDGTNARVLKTDAGGELQVDVLTLPNVTISAFPDNEPFNVAQINGVAPSMGNGTSGTGVQRVSLASDSTGQVAITNATVTAKGTQGANGGIPIQELKDSGRTSIVLYATAAAAGTTTTETAISLTKSAGTAATSAAASWVVTSGKRFRIESISVATRGHNTATAQVTTFNFRLNTAGAVGTTSTPILMAVRSATPATANAWDRVIFPISDGYEILGDGTLQIGMTAAATYTTNAPTWDVTIIGYEY